MPDQPYELKIIEQRLRALEKITAELKTVMDRVENDMYNHGQDGLKTEFTSFKAAYIATEATRRADHKENTERLESLGNRFGLLIAVLLLFVTAIGVLIAYEEHTKTSLLHHFQSEVQTIEAMARVQDAGLPFMK